MSRGEGRHGAAGPAATIAAASLLLLYAVAAVPAAPAVDAGGHEQVQSTIIVQGSDMIRDLLAAEPDTFGRFLERADEYGIQIIYTQIDRDEHNAPTFRQFSWRADPDRYFNPASLVKLPVALVALESVRRLKVPGLDRDTPMIVERGPGCETWQRRAEAASSLSLHIQRMLVVSDNMSYSRVFELCGQDGINGRLHELGYRDLVISRRFCRGTWQQNRTANPVRFLGAGNSVAHSLPARESSGDWTVSALLSAGTGSGLGARELAGRGAAGNAHGNYLSLQVMSDILKAVMFPQSRPPAERLDLTEGDLAFVRRQLALYPRETGLPEYASGTDYRDNHKKYLLHGDRSAEEGTIANDSLRIFNVVGRYEGYLADVAYVVDFDRGVEFMLAAVIDAHRGQEPRGVGDVYAKEGLPFLARLGRAVYRYECARERGEPPVFDDLRSALDAR